MSTAAEVIDAVNLELGRYKDTASKMVSGVIAAAVDEMTGGDEQRQLTKGQMAELREIAISAIGDAFGIFAPNVAALTGDFFDALSVASGLKARGLVPGTGFNMYQYEDSARYSANEMMRGNVSLDKFIWDCQVATMRALDHFHFMGMDWCSERYGHKGIRWARVPIAESCMWCIMLGSRGFVYRSAESAGVSAGHYHSNCDCRIIPSFAEPFARMLGYDEDALYREWKASGWSPTGGSRGRPGKWGKKSRTLPNLIGYIELGTTEDDVRRRAEEVNAVLYGMDDETKASRWRTQIRGVALRRISELS